MYDFFVGIDPGVNGAVSVLRSDGVALESFEVPVLMDKNKRSINVRALVMKLRNLTGVSPALCCIERVHAMPKQGVSSTFSFGRSFGQLESIAYSMDWSVILVRPKEWQQMFFRYASGSDTKEKSRQVATNLFPKVDLSLKKHHNKADSLLLAEYGRKYAITGE